LTKLHGIYKLIPVLQWLWAR